MQTSDLDVAPIERALALRTFPAFEGLLPAELAVMAEHVRPRRFRRGELLSRRGMPIRALHFVLSGCVEVDEGNAEPKRLGPRDVVGGLGALIGDALGQHATAVEETLTLKLDREDMEDVFEDNFEIFLGVLRALSRSLVGLERRFGREVGLHAQRKPSFADGSELGLVERILLLRSSMHFAGTEIEALADLAEECDEIELPERRVLWRVGDGAEHAILLVSGKIRARADDHDPFWFEPGDVIGGVEALCGEPRWYSALAEGRVRGLCIETQRLLDVIEDNMGVGMSLLRIVARGIRDVSERVSA